MPQFLFIYLTLNIAAKCSAFIPKIGNYANNNNNNNNDRLTAFDPGQPG